MAKCIQLRGLNLAPCNSLLSRHINSHLAHRNRVIFVPKVTKKCFTGGRPSQVGSVGRDFLCGKNYTKKHGFYREKKGLSFSVKFIWENILIYFQTFFRLKFKNLF